MQVKQQLGISADAVPPVTKLVEQDAKITVLKARRKELKSKLAAYGDLPSVSPVGPAREQPWLTGPPQDAGMARAKVGEKKQEVVRRQCYSLVRGVADLGLCRLDYARSEIS